jgi:hypothetical protein
MKKKLLLLLLLAGGLCSAPKARAQSFEIEQLLLDVEKLAQFKSILEDLKKGYEIVAKGYTTIKDISEGNFHLHQLFLDGLLEVSPLVKKYYKVSEIIEVQLKIFSEYKAAFNYFKSTGSFNPEEINYMGQVYERLSKKSAANIESLVMVLTAGVLRMSDDERLSSIDAIHQEVKEELDFLRRFNNQNKILIVQRKKAANDVNVSKQLYGIEK